MDQASSFIGDDTVLGATRQSCQTVSFYAGSQPAALVWWRVGNSNEEVEDSKVP